MSTIRLDNKKQTRLVAHRGLSGLETENTHAAFVAAGNRTYLGIETDVHKTADGEFVLIHDDTTGRVAQEDRSVEGSTFAELRAMLLNQKDGNKGRTDIRIPTMEEYIQICKTYDKTAVLELKNRFDKDDIAEVIRRIEALGFLDRVIFISFWYENLIDLRELLPEQPIQFLTGLRDDFDWLVGELASHNMALDVYHVALTKEIVDLCHQNGVEVNCWTVDDPVRAAELIEMGVDYITTNILE